MFFFDSSTFACGCTLLGRRSFYLLLSVGLTGRYAGLCGFIVHMTSPGKYENYFCLSRVYHMAGPGYRLKAFLSSFFAYRWSSIYLKMRFCSASTMAGKTKAPTIHFATVFFIGFPLSFLNIIPYV